MSRAVLTVSAASLIFTTAAVLAHFWPHTASEQSHFWQHMTMHATLGSWLVLAMLWCVNRVVESNRTGWKEVGKKVTAKVDKVETHLDTIDNRLAVVDDHLAGVEDTLDDIDKERVQANAVVVQLFKNRQAR